jgi:MFS family permease
VQRATLIPGGPARPEAPALPPAPGTGALTAGLLLTIVCIAFEGLAVTTAMPSAARALGGLEAYGWTFSAFMLANIVGITFAGRRSDDAGPFAAFAAALALFAAGLVGAGAAPTMPALIAARTVQGLGGGGLGAVVYVCLARCYPGDRQPRMLALLSSAWVVPGLLGPGLAGLAADHLSWRVVFVALVPAVMLAAVLALPPLRRMSLVDAASADDRAGLPTVAAALVVAAGGVAALLGLEARTPMPPLATATGAILLVAGFRRLTPPGTLRARAGLPAAIAVMGLVSVAFFGAEVLLPLLVTVFRDQPSTIAGLALSAATLTWTAGAWVQARHAKRRSRAVLVGGGAGTVALGIVVVALVIDPRVPVVVAWLGWALAGLGMGLAHSTISLTVIEHAPVGREGAASAAMQVANALGVALGAGVGSALVVLPADLGWSQQVGFVLGFAAMVAAALATWWLSHRLSSGRTPATR